MHQPLKASLWHRNERGSKRDKRCLEEVLESFDDHLWVSGMENSCLAEETWQRLQFLKALLETRDATSILKRLR